MVGPAVTIRVGGNGIAEREVTIHPFAWNLLDGTYTVQPGDNWADIALAFMPGLTAETRVLPPPGTVIDVEPWIVAAAQSLLDQIAQGVIAWTSSASKP